MDDIRLAEDQLSPVKHRYKGVNFIIRFRYKAGKTVPFGAIIIAEDRPGTGHVINIDDSTYTAAVATAKQVTEAWHDLGQPSA